MLVVKKDYETERVIAYTVYNTENKKNHSVLFKIGKNAWCCDCTWSSLKETPCSHINEVVKKIRKDKVSKLIKKLKI